METNVLGTRGTGKTFNYVIREINGECRAIEEGIVGCLPIRKTRLII